ncbi:unnamed protein product [Protopolystoma xenopodis]|uniref:C2 domain-containing protein n=1 Tax=Protopolystoma xenopodis TaxID=117903 RepID=A0A448XPV2_9PLAT|nr:unnamed protein product [Protopolystoma xenopodis]
MPVRLLRCVRIRFSVLTGASNAYCVVELDEPYQRHTTHVVAYGAQLFWDQHLLFDLNRNSKRAVFEVFEIGKKKSESSEHRIYTDLYMMPMTLGLKIISSFCCHFLSLIIC